MTKRYTPGPPDDEKRRAIRRSEADLVSAWDNYAAAIDAAKGGDQTRLVNLLRGHRPLEDADRTILADYIATTPGGQGLLRAPPLGEQDFDLLARLQEYERVRATYSPPLIPVDASTSSGNQREAENGITTIERVFLK